MSNSQNFEKFLKEKLATVNKDNIDSIILEIMNTLDDLLRKKISDGENLEELMGLKIKFDNKFSEFKDVLGKEVEEKEKLEVIIAIYKAGFEQISFVSEQGKNFVEVITFNIEKYGRDSKYLNMYKKIVGLPKRVKEFHTLLMGSFEGIQEYGKEENDFIRFEKLEDHYNLSQEIFIKINELKEFISSLTVEIKDYDLEMQKGVPLSEIILEEEETDEVDVQVERTDKLIEISKEQERRRRLREKEEGILVTAVHKSIK